MDSFDPESGQVFSETIIEPRKPEIPWERQPSLPSKRERASRRPRVPLESKTLQARCIRKITSLANDLRPETLADLPENIAIRIWTAIREEERESFNVWKAFIHAGFQRPAFRHTTEIEEFRFRPVTDTFSKLSSPDFAWVVRLNLYAADLEVLEFREVSRITNLESLTVHYSVDRPRNTLHDRIVQAWSQRARTDGAFSRLRILAFVNAPRISASVFEHLNGFPELSSLVLHTTGIKASQSDLKAARRSGWQRHRTPEEGEEDSTLLRPPAWSYKGLEHACHIESFVHNLTDQQGFRREGPGSSTYVLNAHLGYPNVTHIWRSRSGMIWFERDPEFARIRSSRASKDAKGQSAGEETTNGAPLRKRLRMRLKDATEAGFTAMLDRM